MWGEAECKLAECGRRFTKRSPQHAYCCRQHHEVGRRRELQLLRDRLGGAILRRSRSREEAKR